MKQIDIKFINKSINLLKNDEMNHWPKIISIATDDSNNVISIGYNSFEKTHPIQADFAKRSNYHHKIFLHAEIAALIKVKEKKIETLYITRLNKKGNLVLAKPCPVCMLAIKESKIPRIIYSTDDGIKEETFSY